MGTARLTAVSVGGGKRDRTADLLHAMQALSQLSYTPTKGAHYTGGISLCKEWETARIHSKKKTPVRFRTGVNILPAAASNVQRRRSFTSGGQLIAQRQVADALAGRRKHCIDECRGERWNSRFPDSAGGIIDGGSDDVRPNIHGTLAYAQHLVVVEIALLDSAILEGDLVQLRQAQTHYS